MSDQNPLSPATLTRLARFQEQPFEDLDTVVNRVIDIIEGMRPAPEKKKASVSGGKDLSKFSFNGEKYSKARLVHAVIKQFTQDRDCTYEELEEHFPPCFQGF